ncbi:MAG: glycosyltransferase [Verrucomicrobiota bacterium]
MRLLVLSSSTGGGHDMRARSIVSWAAALSTEERPIEVSRYQALESSSRLYGFGVGLYNWIQKRCPWLHHVYFNWLELFQISAHEKLLLGRRRFEALLAAEKPDVIISVHAHTNHAFRAIAKRVLPGVAYVCYCGEMYGGYGFSRHWVDPGADSFIGATPEICEAARQLKMPASQIKYGGFLLSPTFYEKEVDEAPKLREALELEADRFTLLLSTGANGAQNHADLLAALDAAGLRLQVIALCGRNEAAQASLSEYKSLKGDIRLCALGYREDMAALMSISDAMVARPGTGTTSEAILTGCPLLLNTLGGVMPQEWITVKYLRAQGFEAECIKRPRDLARQVAELIEAPSKLAEMRAKMVALRPEPTPREIFEYFAERHLQA